MKNSLYIHIPFCRERCSYCAFNTYTDRSALIDDYIQAIGLELQAVGHSSTGEVLPVHTIYFGGGTPSLLSPFQLQSILDTIRNEFSLTDNLEISLEANPGTVDRDYFHALVELGISRFSLGIQSVHHHELTLFGRMHDWPQAIQAVEDARQAGVTNLSLDLIYGVPNQTLQMWQSSVEQLLALEPDHLSLYALGLESGTEMTRQVNHGQLPMPDPDLAADMYEFATERLAHEGFIQYEISNWGKAGTFCKHNLNYWYNRPYLGIGAGAHGFANHTRTVNAMRPEDYIRRLTSSNKQERPFPQTPATITADVLDEETEQYETIIMGLRLLHEGFSLNDFAERFGFRMEEKFEMEIAQLSHYGLVEKRENHLFLTSRARLISNHVFRSFMQAVEE